MPNPYHDGQGRFCSRNEMLGAIEAARSSGNLSQAYSLQQELEAADGTTQNQYEQFLTRKPSFPQTDFVMDGPDGREYIAVYGETQHDGTQLWNLLDSASGDVKDTVEVPYGENPTSYIAGVVG